VSGGNRPPARLRKCVGLRPADLAVGAFVVAGGALVMCPGLVGRAESFAASGRASEKRSCDEGTVGPDVLVGDNEVRPP